MVDDKGYSDHRWIVGEIVAVHMTKEVFTPEVTLDLDRVNPALYLGREFYLTVLKDTLRYLDRKAYGKC